MTEQERAFRVGFAAGARFVHEQTHRQVAEALKAGEALFGFSELAETFLGVLGLPDVSEAGTEAPYFLEDVDEAWAAWVRGGRQGGVEE